MLNLMLRTPVLDVNELSLDIRTSSRLLLQIVTWIVLLAASSCMQLEGLHVSQT